MACTSDEKHANVFFAAIDDGTGHCMPPELVSLVLSLTYIKKGEHGLLDLSHAWSDGCCMSGVLCLDHDASAWVSGLWSFHFEPRPCPFQWYADSVRLSVPLRELASLPEDIAGAMAQVEPTDSVVRAICTYTGNEGKARTGRVVEATKFEPYPLLGFRYRAHVQYDEEEYSGQMRSRAAHGRGTLHKLASDGVSSGTFTRGYREGLFDEQHGGCHLRSWYKHGRRTHGIVHCTRGEGDDKEAMVIHGDVSGDSSVPSGYGWMKSDRLLCVGCIHHGKLDGEGVRITPAEGRVELAEFDDGEVNMDFPWTRVTCDPAGVGVSLAAWGTECPGVKAAPTHLSASRAQEIKAMVDNLDLSCPVCKIDKQGRPIPIDAGDNHRIAEVVSYRRKRKLDFMLGEQDKRE